MLREEVGILVIDDVRAMRIQIKDLLSSFGFRKIIQCANAEEAKVQLELASVQLILCDWHMSPTAGIDLLKYVRTHDRLARTSFIMITAEDTRELVIEAIQAGVDDYLVKPLTVAQVQGKVHGALIKKKVLE